jgi:Tol biopolymer transport system component
VRPRSSPEVASAAAVAVAVEEPAPQIAIAVGSSRQYWSLIPVLVLLAVAGAAAWRYFVPPPEPYVVKIVQLTRSGTVHPNQNLITDGPRVYFLERVAGTFVLKSMPSGGGTATTVPIGLPHFDVQDISPDNSELLLRELTDRNELRQLWISSVAGGAARRVGDVLVMAATFAPDGQSVLYSQDGKVLSCDRQGGNVRTLFETPGEVTRMRWAPSGDVLRMVIINSTGNGTTMWETRSSDWKLRRVMSDGSMTDQVWMLNWSGDSQWMGFSAASETGREIWILGQKHWWQHSVPHPVRLTGAPIDFDLPTFNKTEKTIYAVGSHRRGQLLRYDTGSHNFVPYLGGQSIDQLDFTHDGQWVTYVTYPERTLWRSKTDGSEALKLTEAPLRVFAPKWSPDGQAIAFRANEAAGKPWQTFVISAKGGIAQPVRGQLNDLGGVGWSGDGRSLIVASEHDGEMQIVDPVSGASRAVPNSKHLSDPVVSPSGRYLLSGNPDDNEIDVLDVYTGERHHLVNDVDYPIWSRDEKFVYFNRFSEWSPAMYRVRVADGAVEKLFELDGFSATGGWSTWSTLAPDGSVLLLRDLGGTDLYSIQWGTK